MTQEIYNDPISQKYVITLFLTKEVEKVMLDHHNNRRKKCFGHNYMPMETLKNFTNNTDGVTYKYRITE